MYWVLAAVVSYALGSINSAIAVSWLLYRDDIRRHGSGNAGASNMFRTYGRTAALLTLLGDMFKTLAAVTLTRLLFRWIAGGDPGFDPGWFAGLFAILGHVFPIWFGFRGGKGVLVAAVTVLAVDPAAFGVMAVLAIVVFALWHTMSIVSLVSAGLLPIVFLSLACSDIGSHGSRCVFPCLRPPRPLVARGQYSADPDRGRTATPGRKKRSGRSVKPPLKKRPAFQPVFFGYQGMNLLVRLL